MQYQGLYIKILYLQPPEVTPFAKTNRKNLITQTLLIFNSSTVDQYIFTSLS